MAPILVRYMEGRAGGERGNATAAASGQITCLISQYVSSLGGVLSAAGRG